MIKMIRFAIVDDDLTYLEYLKKETEKYLENVEYEIKTYSSYKDLLADKTHLEKLDILISDIELEFENGIKKAKKIKEENPNLCVIFVSGFIQYVMDVYDVDHIYFILKDQLKMRLGNAISNALKCIKNKNKKDLIIKWQNEVNVIPIKDIVYVEREGRKCHVHTKDEEYSTYVTFQDIAEQLGDFFFLRTHYSYLVKLSEIYSFQRNEVFMKNGVKVPVSRSYEKKAKKKFLNYLSGAF